MSPPAHQLDCIVSWAQYLMGQAMVDIRQEDCTGCDRCIPHCPFEALLPLAICPDGFNKRPVIVREEACVGCLSCIGSCPTNALFEIVIPQNSLKSPLNHPNKHLLTQSIDRWSKAGLKWA